VTEILDFFRFEVTNGLRWNRLPWRERDAQECQIEAPACRNGWDFSRSTLEVWKLKEYGDCSVVCMRDDVMRGREDEFRFSYVLRHQKCHALLYAALRAAISIEPSSVANDHHCN
jgi:hypothetical protein